MSSGRKNQPTEKERIEDIYSQLLKERELDNKFLQNR
jgi:hypothetical protein